MIIEFGQWTPDLTPLREAGCINARNVLPAPGGFRSFKGPTNFGDAIPDPPITGSFWLQDESGVYYNFAATANQLYRMTSNSWSAVGAGSYGAASSWQFARFGGRVIAVAKGVAPQYFDLGVSSSFAALPGSPPNATRIAIVRDQVVLGGTSRTASPIPSGEQVIEWSGIDNNEAWRPSLRTQSGTKQFFSRGGNVQAVTPGQVGYVIREHSIHRMTYIGTPIVFRFDELAQGIGTPSRDSVCWLGEQIFFQGHDGFYALINGQVVKIGQNKVDDWFLRRCSDTADVVGAVDRRNRRVFWAFRGSSAAQYDTLLCFDLDLAAWSYADISLDWIDEFSVPGLNLDELDSVLPGGIDATSFAVDSDQFIGGAIQLAGFNSSGQGVTFTNQAVAGVIETREFSEDPSRRIFIQGVTPLVNAESSTSVVGRLGVRERQNAEVKYGDKSLQASSGELKFRESTRLARVELQIEGEFTHAHGVDVRSTPLGGRR